MLTDCLLDSNYIEGTMRLSGSVFWSWKFGASLNLVPLLFTALVVAQATYYPEAVKTCRAPPSVNEVKVPNLTSLERGPSRCQAGLDYQVRPTILRERRCVSSKVPQVQHSTTGCISECSTMSYTRTVKEKLLPLWGAYRLTFFSQACGKKSIYDVCRTGVRQAHHWVPRPG